MQQRRPGFPAQITRPASAPRMAAPTPVKPQGQVAQSPPSAPQGMGLDSAAVRARMVQRLAAAGITAQPVLQALGAVERHRFVDTALANQAYEDTSLPIGLGQTISKPSVVARMAELLVGAQIIQQTGTVGRVLEIGTGCGYQAAVLGRLAREVYTIERLRGLHERARANLRPLRLTNVHLIFGDGMAGYAKGAPYAAIIAAAGGETVPAAWCDQLAVGGRLVAPIQKHVSGQQVLLVIDRTAQGFKESVLETVHFVPLKSGVA
jgi:protein-L-isoaspartate(D-aspartate) O-methyltransferase